MSELADTSGHNLAPVLEQQALRIEVLRSQIAGVEAVRSSLEREEANRPPRKQRELAEAVSSRR